MQPYASIEFYRDTFKGSFFGSNAELESLLVQASRNIDTLTFNRIVAAGIESLTSFQLNLVRLATCYQADYNHNVSQYGGGLNSFSVNGVSVSIDKAKSAAQVNNFDEQGFDLLRQTGLMWQGVR